jgi:hypothetical protein
MSKEKFPINGLNEMAKNHDREIDLSKCINCQILGFQKACTFLLVSDFGSKEVALDLMKDINAYIQSHPAFSIYAKHFLKYNFETGFGLEKR